MRYLHYPGSYHGSEYQPIFYLCIHVPKKKKQQQVKTQTYSAKRLLQTKQPSNYIQVDISISNFKKNKKNTSFANIERKIGF